MAKKEKHRWFSDYVVHVCLFAKGCFCHLLSENAGQFEREKQISFSHSLIALINPASYEGERTDETTRFLFLLPTDPPSFFRPQDHRHCGVSYRAVYPKLCMFSHPLLV